MPFLSSPSTPYFLLPTHSLLCLARSRTHKHSQHPGRGARGNGSQPLLPPPICRPLCNQPPPPHPLLLPLLPYIPLLHFPLPSLSLCLMFSLPHSPLPHQNRANPTRRSGSKRDSHSQHPERGPRGSGPLVLLPRPRPLLLHPTFLCFPCFYPRACCSRPQRPG
ncbi:unnamed protein product [Closterium sp. NIES-54]